MRPEVDRTLRIAIIACAWLARPVAPPVCHAWTSQVELGEPGTRAAAALGMLILPVIGCWLPNESRGTSDDFSFLLALASVPVGDLAGGIIGAARPRWTRLWHRPNPAGVGYP